MSTTFLPRSQDTRTDRDSDDAVGWTEVKDLFGKFAPRALGER